MNFWRFSVILGEDCKSSHAPNSENSEKIVSKWNQLGNPQLNFVVLYYPAHRAHHHHLQSSFTKIWPKINFANTWNSEKALSFFRREYLERQRERAEGLGFREILVGLHPLGPIGHHCWSISFPCLPLGPRLGRAPFCIGLIWQPVGSHCNGERVF